MGISGSIILFFLVVHLRTFFFPHRFLHPESNMYQDVVTAFQNGWYVVLYVFSVLLLGLHLNHGFQSAFQSLGLNSKYYAPVLKISGTAFALIMALGFASFPIVYYFHLLS